MKRAGAKKWLHIIEAWSNGVAIQYYSRGIGWCDIHPDTSMEFDVGTEYRVKPAENFTTSCQETCLTSEELLERRDGLGEGFYKDVKGQIWFRFLKNMEEQTWALCLIQDLKD